MFRTNTMVTIRRPAAPDGSSGATEFTVPALVIASEEVRDDGSPGVRFRRSLLIPPPKLPSAGDLAVCGSEVWEIRSVRICRDLDGVVVAARCQVKA